MRKLGTVKVECPVCGTSVTMATSNRRKYCSGACRRVARNAMRVKVVVRSLAKGERVPEGVPLRYMRSNGYIGLRWTLPDGSLVEALEHRIFDGRNSEAEHVHHINHARHDNRRENLIELTAAEHSEIHRASDHERQAQMKAMYESGMPTTAIAQALGTNAGNVYRALVTLGVPIRPASSYAKPIPDEAVQRFRDGEGAGAISRSMGVSYRRLVQHLEAHGLRARPVGRVPQ